MQPQIPLPYGANIHKRSRFTYTFVQKAGGSMAPETDGGRYSQDNQGPVPASQASVTTSIKDAYVALKEEAHAPLVYPGSRKPTATIGVLDVHSAKDKISHGEKVTSIISGAGFEPGDIQRVDHSTVAKSNFSLASLIYQEGEEPIGQRLDAYIELSAAHILTKTNGTLGQILADPNNRLTTINQSQGSSRVDVFQLLESASFWKPEGEDEQLSAVGERLATACGLDVHAADFSNTKLRQAFVDRINQVVEGSQYISGEQRAHVELLENLRRRGTIVVTSAGNNADELWNFRGRGLNVPDSFDDDLCKVGPKLIVGALDDHGTADKADDEIAYFTSLYAGVNLMANGVMVPTADGPATGTSYAAPQVAAVAEKVRRQHPEWTVDQVEQETRGQFTATDGFNILR